MTDTPDEEEEKSTHKLSDDDWKEASRLYEVEDQNLVDIADKFGVSRQALSKRFKASGVVRGAKKPAVGPVTAPEPDRFSNKREEWIEETRMEGYNSLRQASMLARKIVIDAMKAKIKIDAVEDQIRAAQRYSRLLQDNLAARLTLLDAAGYVGGEDLPMLQIEDLTDEEILQHHKNTGVYDESVTVEDMLQEEIELGNLDE